MQDRKKPIFDGVHYFACAFFLFIHYTVQHPPRPASFPRYTRRNRKAT